jgi:hypothetical protein
LEHDLDKFLTSATNESPLAKANLIAAAIERFDPTTKTRVWVTWIMELAAAVDATDAEVVLSLLNEDRTVAGFPAVPSVEAVATALDQRRRAYREVVTTALDRMKTAALVRVVGSLVDVATAKGTRHGPILIDDVIDDYDAGVRSFLEREAENARRLIEAVRDSAAQGEAVVERLLDGLERVARNWTRVAGPIQVSMRARGQEHVPSRDLANEVRSLAVELANAYGMYEPAQRITRLLQEAFADVVSVAEPLQEDTKVLGDLAEEQRAIRERNEQWAREIAYEAHLGFFSKTALRLSTAGVQWGDRHYPLQSVTRVGWGGTRHSVDFIPTGTTYKILFGDDGSLCTVELGDKRVFSDFIDRLWRAIGVRLLVELAQGLRQGNRYQWGSAVLDDRGIEIPKRRLFRPEERVYATWDRVEVWSADGSFYIGVKGDRSTCVGFSYQEANNAHILEVLIRTAFERGVDRLSDTLEGSAE